MSIRADSPGPRAPLSERICDAACLVFALWTLCTHLAVFSGAGLRTLLIVFASAAVTILVILYVRRSRRAAAVSAVLPASPSPVTSPVSGRSLKVARAGAAVGGLVLLAVAAPFTDVVTLWWWSVGLLAVAAVITLREPGTDVPPVRRPSLERLLFALALACAVLALVCHRPDLDDTFYVNLAATAADHPDAPLLSQDTLHGIPDLPLHLFVYRFHTYEIWNGALSYLTGIPAIYCFHWVSASLLAFLVPLAYARLFRVLVPRAWLVAVFAVVFVLVVAGETHRWYGNFAFVRIWQGKAAYLQVFLPLIYTYALDFARRPGWRSWTFLCAAQVAAVGLTSSAIWGAPVAAGLALVCAVELSSRSLALLSLGGLTTVAVLAAGWYLRSNLESQIRGLEINPVEAQGAVREALTTVLGDSRLLTFALASILLGWVLCPPGLAQRFAVVFPLAVLLVPLNPYFSSWITTHLTGRAYWRGLWALPVPILMALVLISPVHLAPRRGWSLAATAVLLAVFAVWVPRYSAISRQNDVRLAWPGLKVEKKNYELAAFLTRSASPGSFVVAPPGISNWLATFHHQVFPLRVRDYLETRVAHRLLGARNVRARKNMTYYVNGALLVPDAREVFAAGLRDFGIEAVCLRVTRYADATRDTLRTAGFHLASFGRGYEIWTMKPVNVPRVIPDTTPPPVRRHAGRSRDEWFVAAEETVFNDGFEDGTTRSWSSSIP